MKTSMRKYKCGSKVTMLIDNKKSFKHTAEVKTISHFITHPKCHAPLTTNNNWIPTKLWKKFKKGKIDLPLFDFKEDPFQ